jgi:hypothetical protein
MAGYRIHIAAGRHRKHPGQELPPFRIGIFRGRQKYSFKPTFKSLIFNIVLRPSADKKESISGGIPILPEITPSGKKLKTNMVAVYAEKNIPKAAD